MIVRPPRYIIMSTPVPYATLFRSHIVVNARGDDRDQTAGGGEGNGVIHQIFYDTEQPLLIAHHDRDAASGAGKSYAYIIGNIARLPRHDQPFDGVAQIDRIELGAGKLGVDARSFGDIRHQPVQAADVDRKSTRLNSSH